MRGFLLLSLAALLTAATARAETSLVEGRLSVDALIWVNCHWKQSEVIGLTDRRFDFYRRAAFVGLTGRMGSVASIRFNLDAASVSVYDLYVDFRWPNGIGLRAGQFVAPLSSEAWTSPRDLKLVEYSLIGRYWKPYGSRDIGVMARYDGILLEAAGAIVNGNGRNQIGDNNNRKDICGRVAFKPWTDCGLRLACRGYNGWVDEALTEFKNVAGELLFDQRPIHVLVEGQHAVVGTSVRNSFHLQAAYGLAKLLEPVARFQMEFQREDKFDFGVTAGLNFLVLGDRLKVMVNYNDWRRGSVKPENRVREQAVFLQVQGAI